jgi:ribosome-binding protein aMBF1 (putative translation factor)
VPPSSTTGGRRPDIAENAVLTVFKSAKTDGKPSKKMKNIKKKKKEKKPLSQKNKKKKRRIEQNYYCIIFFFFF